MRVEPGDEKDVVVYETGLRLDITPSFWDVETMLGDLDREGIDVALPSIAAPVFLYELQPSATAEASALINDAAASLASASQGRLRPLATVPLNDPEGAAEELRRAHGLGLVGVEVGTTLGPLTLDEPQFDPFLAAAAELRMPVLLHPYLSMSGEGLPAALRRFFLSNVVGNPFETVVAASRLVLGGTFDRHPSLRVVLSHGGGAFPYQLGRLRHAHHQLELVREVVARDPLEYLENFLFDTVIYEPRSLAFLVDLVGAERVVFGTDQPFFMSDLSALRLADDPGSDVAPKVLAENACREFGLAQARVPV